MIELKDVCFAYDGIPALRHIDLKIEKGETVILRGGNGNYIQVYDKEGQMIAEMK